MNVEIGRKCGMLLHLRRAEPFRSLIPALVPVPRTLGDRFLTDHPEAWTLAEPTRLALFDDWLQPRVDPWVSEIEQTCGPPPWIVRSSGEEDAPDAAMAGVYRSRLCPDRGSFGATLGEVMLAAPDPGVDPGVGAGAPEPAPIAAFVQSVVGRSPRSAPTSSFRPYLAPELLAELRTHLGALHARFPGEPLLCEWVLDGDSPVSMTTATERSSETGETGETGETIGNGACAFGLFSAQQGGLNVRFCWLPGVSEAVYGGGSLRPVTAGAWRLVQVRVARYIHAASEVPQLSPEQHAELVASGHETVEDLEVLVVPRSIRRGAFLTSASLSMAWTAFSRLGASDRGMVSVVLVREGSAEEHAGINFLGHGVAVARFDPAAVPDGARSAAMDPARGRCYFGTEPPEPKTLPATTTRRWTLPAHPFLPAPEAELRALPADRVSALVDLLLADRIDPEEAAAAAGDALAPLVTACALPGVAAPVREKLFESSLIPRPHTRLHTAGARGDSSPSLLGRLLELRRDAVLADGGPSRFARLDPSHPTAAYVRARTEPTEPGGLGVASREILLAWRPEARLPRTITGGLLALAGRLVADDLDALCVQSARRFDDATTALGLHSPAERERLWESWLEALSPLGAERIVPALQSSPLFPAELSLVWIRHCAEHPDLDGLSHESRLVWSMQSPAWRESPEVGRETRLPELYRDLRDSRLPAALRDFLVPSIIDGFDHDGKARLALLLAARSETARRDYQRFLEDWLELLPALSVPERIRDLLRDWVRDHPGARVVEPQVLEDRRWTEWLRDGLAHGALDLPNLHQLHNVLHQSSLAHCDQAAALERMTGMPETLRRTLAALDACVRSPCRLLRYEPRRIEIERCSDIHKASLMATPDGVETTFLEPPSAPPSELGRLDVLERALERLPSWLGLEVRHHRICQEGTWGLHIRLAGAELPELALVLATLFDSAGDLSRSEPPAHVDELFEAAAWKDLFRDLVAYRSEIDESEIFRDPLLHPLSRLFAHLCADPETAAAWPAWCGLPFSELMDRFLELARIPARARLEEWIDRQRRLDLLALALSVRHPVRTFEALRERPRLGDGFLALGRGLCCRRSLRSAIRSAGRAPAAEPSAFQRFLLHHKPEWLCSEETVHVWGPYVGARPGELHRAAVILLHRFADRLEPEVLGALATALPALPYGAEDRVERALAPSVHARPRYDVRRCRVRQAAERVISNPFDTRL